LTYISVFALNISKKQFSFGKQAYISFYYYASKKIKKKNQKIIRKIKKSQKNQKITKKIKESQKK